MGTALLVVAAVLFIGAVVVFVMALRRPKEPRGARQDPLRFNATPEFGPRQLGPGAIVSHGGIDYVVRGSVTYREGPFVWWEHLLEGGDQPIWFSVEEDDGRLKLAMWVSRKEFSSTRRRARRRRCDLPGVRTRSRRIHHRGDDGPAGRRRHGLRRLQPTPTRPRCSPSSAGRRTCRGRFPPARPC